MGNGGFLSFWGGVLSDTYPNVSHMYPAWILGVSCCLHVAEIHDGIHVSQMHPEIDVSDMIYLVSKIPFSCIENYPNTLDVSS